VGEEDHDEGTRKSSSRKKKEARVIVGGEE